MKRKLLLLPALFMALGFGAIVSTSKPIMVNAEDTPTEEVVVVEEEKEPTWEEKIKSFKDTYLVPILSGVSITSVLSATISIALAILNRKTNKLIKKDNGETTALALEIIKSTVSLIEEMKLQNTISEETKKAFIETTDKLIEKIVEQNGLTEKMLQIKQILVTFAEIETEIAKIDPKAITSGVASSIAKLNEQIKALE